jgi:hypothetical protein
MSRPPGFKNDQQMARAMGEDIRRLKLNKYDIEGWQDLPLATGFSTDPTFMPARFYRAFDRVYLAGAVTATATATSPALIDTPGLPDGYGPVDSHTKFALSVDTQNSVAPGTAEDQEISGLADISTPTGEITVHSVLRCSGVISTTVRSGVVLLLDGVQWRCQLALELP